MNNSKFTTIEKALLLVWFVVNLAIGALTVQEYGVSIDEPNNHRYAVDTLDAYPSLFGTLYKPKYNSSYNGHGPAFVAIILSLIKITQVVIPKVFTPNIWHYSYFIMFQMSCLCIYWLSRRWFNNWVAWGILLLFSTQPLLMGHAFINPKDIPFMALFIASIATGFAMVDSITKASYAKIEMENNTSIDNFGWVRLKEFLSQFVKSFTNPSVLLAGILLGLTTSVRILGPYAGVIVGLYALYKSARRTSIIFPAYFVVTALVCYLTWPFLWGDALVRFWQAFSVASDFAWSGSVLFEGQVIAAKELPARYLPKMMSIQFTEIAIALFIMGVGMAFKKKFIEPLALIVIWFLTPLATIILNRSVVYDGFRHILFLVPPLFICAGFAFDWIFDKLKAVPLRLLVLTLVTVPGIFSIVKLYPYEYVYYNSFVGGIQGAYKKYELDYWAISYREVALFVNEIAQPNANIVLFGTVGTYIPYSRPDIKLYESNDLRKIQQTKNIDVEYAVIFNRKELIQDSCRNAEIIKSVERDGAVLAVLKKVLPTGDNCP